MRVPKILGGGLLLLALALTNPACGGGETAAAQAETAPPTPAAATAAASAGRTPAPLPTRPQRLDHLLRTPTAVPDATAGRTGSQEARTGTTGETGGTPPPEPRTGGDDPLAPEDARFTDEVLLQDIYERIDLEQFALDPREPIGSVYDAWEAGEYHLWSPMLDPLVHQHPYLHIFPDLEKVVEEQRETGLTRDFSYIPNKEFRTTKIEDLAGIKDRMTYFIYHPWFEPVFADHRNRSVLTEQDNRLLIGDYQQHGTGLYWFGNNSTRGVLAETVTELIRDASKPGVTPAQRAWWAERDRGGNLFARLEMRDWTVEEFIRANVMSEEGIQLPIDRKTREPDKEFWNAGINQRQNPKVEWEILHPQLPILRITAHASYQLPLQYNPEGNEWDAGGGASFSVSFVISLQHRWESFQDPNRWIIRFRGDLESYWPPNHLYSEDSEIFISGKLNELEKRLSGAGMPYPNYWHHTDYMQHRIIGPVVMTVHGDGDVLAEGTYSRVPRITHWEAPGHILTEEQVMKVDRGLTTGRRSIFSGDVIRLYPDLGAPNAGWPLPGHVMTGPRQGPGTEVWREYGMEGYDW